MLTSRIRALAAASCLIASTAFGGATIILEPSHEGPFQPGETTTVDVQLLQEVCGEDFGVRLAQLDFGASDPDLTFDSVFAFDYSDLALGGGLYAEFASLPVATTAYTQATPDPEGILAFPAVGYFHLGTINVTMPTIGGTYVMDVMNFAASEANPNFGARIDYGFTGLSTWTPANGELMGGTYAFNVVPEPGTLGLIALGALAALRRRKR